MSDAERPGHSLVIDRFEGKFAAVELEGGGVIDLPVWMLPPGARAGDVVRVTRGPGQEVKSVLLTVDADATAARRSAAEARLRRLRRRDPGGDLQG